MRADIQPVVQRTFFHYGWLLPTLLPITHAGGRAAYLILAGIYVLWGLAALYRAPVQLNRAFYWAIVLWAVLLCSYLPGAWYAYDSWRAFDKWIGFAYQTLVFPLTLIVLCQGGDRLQRLTVMLGLGGLITVLALYTRLLFDITAPDFEPEFYLREDNLPWLLPFMLAWFMTVLRPVYGYTLLPICLAAVLAYIFWSDGRSALLGVTLSLAVYALIGLGWNVLWTACAAIGIFVFGVIEQSDRFLRLVTEHSDLHGLLRAITSFRSVLWQRAIENPPDSFWWGIGMGNLRYETALMQVGGLHLGHLHNFLLDAWYETGIVGLFALLLFIAFPLLRLGRYWCSLTLSEQRLAGIYLAVVAALLSAALFSFSYNSKQFAMYLLLMLVVLLYLAESARVRANKQPSST